MIQSRQHSFPVRDYDLTATLNSGQAFRWKSVIDGWAGVIGSRWVRLSQTADSIEAEVAMPVGNWKWLEDYLQLGADLSEIRELFPKDEALANAIKACPGLHLLRQEPWECLASFILSSTKQIPHIRQIVELLCENYGEPIKVPSGISEVKSFPAPERIADCSEAELRKLKMGYRAPFLLKTAQMISRSEVRLDEIFSMSLSEARNELLRFPGVGRKIADCVLLFAFGFQEAFPVDTWILKVLNELYFPNEQRTHRQLLEFTESYFGPHAGYAQQYLFHHIRMTRGKVR